MRRSECYALRVRCGSTVHHILLPGLLRTFGVKEAEIAIAEKHTEIDDEEEGPKYTCTRTVSMRVPITTAARIENITREIEWEGDEILVKPVRSAPKEATQKEDTDMTEQATGTGSKRGLTEDGDSATDEDGDSAMSQLMRAQYRPLLQKKSGRVGNRVQSSGHRESLTERLLEVVRSPNSRL